MNGLGNIIQQFSTPENQQMSSLLGVNMRPQFPLPRPEMQPDPSLAGPMAQLPNDPRIAQALKPKPFAQDGKGWKIIGMLGDALQTAGGGKPTYLPYLTEQQKLQQEHDKTAAAQALDRQKFDWQRKKDNRDVRTIGRRLLTVPVEGDPSILYTAPTDAQDYAESIGINPGDPNYVPTIQDKELGSNGPTAFDHRQQLEDQRYGHRVELRTQPTYANLHPRPGGGDTGPRAPRSVGEAIAPIIVKLRNGQPLTASDQQALSYYGPGRGRRSFTPSPPGPSAPVRVSSPEQARKLAPGTVFMTPDGRTKVR